MVRFQFEGHGGGRVVSPKKHQQKLTDQGGQLGRKNGEKTPEWKPEKQLKEKWKRCVLAGKGGEKNQWGVEPPEGLEEGGQ